LRLTPTPTPSLFSRSPRQMVRAAMGNALPRSWFMLSGPPESNGIALTFDDGPDAEHTPRILDVLKELQIVATFFMIGHQVKKYPAIVRRVVAEGHEVGHHSYWHRAPESTSALALRKEIRDTGHALHDAAGIHARLFRPPHGKLTPAKLAASWAYGFSVILWNVDPKDYAQPHGEAVLRSFGVRPLRGGDLVLLHDNCPHSAAILPSLALEARKHGLVFVTPSHWTQ
jgi:peptidoglycan-N-acetylglucosamine deacetylase